MTDYQPTEINGIVASPEERWMFRARSPFEWQADAMTMLAFAAAGVEVPEVIASRASHILYASAEVVGNVPGNNPLEASQIASAQIAERIIYNLVKLGHVSAQEN